MEALTDLKRLESHMATATYIDGVIPTKKDVSVFKAISEPDASMYPNAARWYSHIASFPKAKLDALPGAFESLTVTKTAVQAPAPPKAEAKAKPEGKAPPAAKAAPPAAKAAAGGSSGATKVAAGGSSGAMEETLRAALSKDGSVADSLPFAKAHGFDHAALIGVCKSLSSEKWIATESLSQTVVQLSAEGEESAKLGSPEARLYAMIPAAAGIPQEELMALAGSAGKVGLAKAIQAKWVEVVKDGEDSVGEDGKKKAAPKRVKRLAASVRDEVQEQLRAVQASGGSDKALAADVLTALKKRNLLSIVQQKSVSVRKGAAFDTWGQKALADITHEMLVKGTWRTAVFKPLNLEAQGEPTPALTLTLTPDPHPLAPEARGKTWPLECCSPTAVARVLH